MKYANKRIKYVKYEKNKTEHIDPEKSALISFRLSMYTLFQALTHDMRFERQPHHKF